MKLLLLLAAVGSSAGLVATGVLPCPCEIVSQAMGSGPEAADACATGTLPDVTGLYLEARNATVWGGACHIGSEAVSQGTHATLGWAFESGEHAGSSLEGVRLVAAVQGATNLQGQKIHGGEPVQNALRASIWVQAPNAAARAAAVNYVIGAASLPADTSVTDAAVGVSRDGDRFSVSVKGVLSVEGDAMPDRSCCTMPESLWYSPLDVSAHGAVVGNPDTCRFEGVEGLLEAWAFEGENSAFLARIGA